MHLPHSSIELQSKYFSDQPCISLHGTFGPTSCLIPATQINACLWKGKLPAKADHGRVFDWSMTYAKIHYRVKFSTCTNFIKHLFHPPKFCIIIVCILLGHEDALREIENNAYVFFLLFFFFFLGGGGGKGVKRGVLRDLRK